MQSFGFNLIELLIGMAIVVILLAIAYPSYQRPLRYADCQAAKIDLLLIATDLERHHNQYNTYQHATLRWHHHHDYQFQFDVLTKTSYRVTATAHSKYTHHNCDQLQINKAGFKKLI
jgi:prepilin-type N-terminal cleavage/methylation domain-containing protein